MPADSPYGDHPQHPESKRKKPRFAAFVVLEYGFLAERHASVDPLGLFIKCIVLRMMHHIDEYNRFTITGNSTYLKKRKKTMKNLKTILLAACISLSMSNIASASTEVIEAGYVTRVNGLTVNGVDYNLEFGKFTDNNALFAGYDETQATPFNVALNDLIATFHSSGKVIAGCTADDCSVMTLFKASSGLNGFFESYYSQFGASTNYNNYDGDYSKDKYSGNFGYGYSFAKWTAAPAMTTTVPEPDAYMILLAGLGVLGIATRRKAA